MDCLTIEPNLSKQLQEIRDKYDDDSWWSRIKKSPLAFSLYTALQYPKVFVKKKISNNSLNPTWTIHQESFIRTLKWTFDAPLITIRKNLTFLEYVTNMFGCSEPRIPLKDVDGIKGYLLGPTLWKGRHPDAIILYVHGGGCVSMSSFFGIRFLCYLIKRLRVQHDKHIRVLAIDYNLAPEDPFPSGLNSIKKAYEWLINESCIPGNKNVFLCGDSSGANMILGLLQFIHSTDKSENTIGSVDKSLHHDISKNNNNEDHNNDKSINNDQQQLVGVILISPWVELSCGKSPYLTNSNYDYLSGQFASVSAENYLFGNIGDPDRLPQLYQQPVDEPLILSWLEKVEDSFDFVGINDPDYYNKLPQSSITDVKINGWSNRRFSKNSQRTSRSSFMTAKTSPRSLRNSRNRDSLMSIIIDSYLNNNNYYNGNRKPTKSYIYNDNNNGFNSDRNNNYDNVNDDNDDFNELRATTKKISPNHTLKLQQIFEKNKAEKLRNRLFTNDLYVNPLVSPLYIKDEILAKFPPLFISYGGKEIFKDCIETFCKKCIESKNHLGDSIPNHDENNHPDVIIETDAEMVHAYPIFVDAFGEHSKNTLNNIASFISSKISPTNPLLSYYKNIKIQRRNSGFIIYKPSTSIGSLTPEDDHNDISTHHDLSSSLTSDTKNTKILFEQNNITTINDGYDKHFPKRFSNSRILPKS